MYQSVIHSMIDWQQDRAREWNSRDGLTIIVISILVLM